MSYLNKWQSIVDQSNFIFTWTERETLAYLAEQASKAYNIVELGTYMGRSAKVMLDANPTVHLWAVDKFMVAGTLDVTNYFLKAQIDSGRCEIIVGDSERAGGMLQHMRGKLDLVFVDDGHATEDVQRDIKWFLPLVRPGGLICGHDFEVPHNDVAIGVLTSIDPREVFFPVPRVWAHIKK
jgi:predicted O-methyltransferase YrrM